jgi:hypothetical protein
MKFIKYGFIALTVLSIASCSKGLNTVEFTINYTSSFDVPSSIGLNTPLSFPTPDVSTNSTDEFKKHDVSVDKIKEVKLKSLQLSITNPSGSNFSFLKSIHIYISSPNISETEIGYLNDVPATEVINLILIGTDLAPYIKANSFKLRSQITTDETNPQTTIKTDMNFDVTAKVL